MRCAAAAALAVVTLLHVARVSGATQPLRSPADLRRAIFTDVKPANACVRLLNATHEVGCAVSDGGTAKGALIHWHNYTVTAPSDETAVVLLVPPGNMGDAIEVAASSPIVKGILVESGPVPRAGSSDAATFPNAAYAPYADRSHKWNPLGSGLERLRVDVPVMLLEGDAAADAARRAADNALQGFSCAVHYAELQTTMSAQHNSTACIADGSCLPLGGHSVWAALPPLPPAGDAARDQEPLPITLLVASVDAGGFFHDGIVGAEATMSGLIAMLAAADALGKVQRQQAEPYRRRIVFLALAGEPWDYMGSRRLLWEMQRGSNATAGLDLDLIDQVIDLGQVGLGLREAAGQQEAGPAQFYLHTQRGSGFGDPSAVADALQSAGSSKARASMASDANPGVPPGSLFSFLRAKPSVAAAALTDFDTAFANRFYDSRFDNGSNVDVGSIATAAVVVARALHTLAAGPHAAPLQVNDTATADLVGQLHGCLVLPKPGLGCELVQRLMSTSGAPPQHYIGVLYTLTADSQDPDPAVKGDLSRFLWNFLAQHTAAPQAAGSSGEQPCDFGQHACSGGRACVGYHAALKWPDSAGRCVAASARYVPSYSTHLRCDGCDGAQTFYDANRWQVTDEAREWEHAAGWPPDPLWTESNWPAGQPSLLLYQAESPKVVRTTWLLGWAATGFTTAALLAARAWMLKRR